MGNILVKYGLATISRPVLAGPAGQDEFMGVNTSSE